MSARPLALLLVLASGAAQDDVVDRAERACAEGRFAEACRLLRAHVETERDAAAPELLVDLGVAGLRAGSDEGVELAIARLRAGRGARWHSFADFLAGNLAFARGAREQVNAMLLVAEPTGFARAIVEVERAAAAWQSAAVSRDDWPEARRNLERALRKLDELRAQKRDAEGKRAERGPPPIELPPPVVDAPREPPPPPPDAPPEEALLEPALAPLAPDAVRALLDVLQRKEREKQAIRRAEQDAVGARGERDW